MSAKTTHFKVGNGDMSLVLLDSGRRILIDCKITMDADNPDHEAPDVGEQLRDRLIRDAQGRLYVDAFLLTHPDLDHCAGLRRHFHLGTPDSWVEADDKIIIREMWSSPIVFRRAKRAGVPHPCLRFDLSRQSALVRWAGRPGGSRRAYGHDPSAR